MKTHKRVIAITALCLLQACATAPKDSTPVAGTYYGKLPCADCPGINYTLTLNADKTYIESSEYLGEKSEPIVEKGSYSMKKDVLTLQPASQSEKQLLRKVEATLVMLDKNGNEVSGDLASNYVLTHEKPAPTRQMPILMATFRASGNEPFWGMEIRKNNDLIFFPSGISTSTQYTFSNPKIQDLKDGNGTLYTASSEGGSIRVSMVRQVCSDGMSEQQHSHKVTVEFTPTGATSATHYEGCGDFLADYRLHDIWALESINGMAIDKAAMEKGIPTMEINVLEKKVSGMAGCNQYSGNIELGQSTITFSSMLSTKMACKDMKVEDLFLQAISDKTMIFTLGKGFLTLKSGQSFVVLKKVD